MTWAELGLIVGVFALAICLVGGICYAAAVIAGQPPRRKRRR